MGSLRVGHNWATSFSRFTFIIGEGNGNPLQCSCLENPRDRGAWWAAIYGVTQSRTRLKQLSSSSSMGCSSLVESIQALFNCSHCWASPVSSVHLKRDSVSKETMEADINHMYLNWGKTKTEKTIWWAMYPEILLFFFKLSLSLITCVASDESLPLSEVQFSHLKDEGVTQSFPSFTALYLWFHLISVNSSLKTSYCKNDLRNGSEDVDCFLGIVTWCSRLVISVSFGNPLLL